MKKIWRLQNDWGAGSPLSWSVNEVLRGSRNIEAFEETRGSFPSSVIGSDEAITEEAQH